MHAAAFRALGLEHTYDAVRAREDELGAWVEKLRRGEVGGINVTVPHKRAAMRLADDVDPIARACDACNVLALRHDDGRARVVAFDTDVPALADELRASRANGDVGVVLGSGGAARAAVLALAELGAKKIIVRSRIGNIAGLPATLPISNEPLASTKSERGATWIVQATSAGMTGADSGDAVARAVDFSLVARDAIALDVIYAPHETPFMTAARAAGISTKNGLGMLARQGALALELWLSVKAPLDVMLAAIQ
jgi:shikimate dehydrogenase